MKYSKYNSIISVSKRYRILYNAISDKFIILKEAAYNDLSRNEPDILVKKNLLLYKQLVDVNGVVDNTLDESKLVADLIRKIDNNDSIYYLHINPTVDCNFRCWYCYENHVKGSKMSYEVMESVKKLMEHTINNQPNLQTFILSFFGGEPLMYFDIIARPLIDYLYTLCTPIGKKVKIHFTSNGYLLNKSLIDYLKNKDVSFQITLDGARENHNQTRFTKNKKGSYDQIIRNIKDLARIGARVILRINYTAANISNVYKIQQDLEDLEMPFRNRVCIDFQRVWQDIKSENSDAIDDIINRQIKSFHVNGYMASSHKIIDLVRNSCYADKRNHALINYNGDVFNCTARDFSTNNRTGYLRPEGLIQWENNHLERRMMIKFSNPICINCRIAPLCGGGCTQRALECHHSRNCIYSYNDDDINRIILNRFDLMFLNYNCE
jgi:uncharacterized protein